MFKGYVNNTFEIAKRLEAIAELEKDKQDLKDLGLTNEEIMGYEEMYIENYIIKPLHTVLED